MHKNKKQKKAHKRSNHPLFHKMRSDTIVFLCKIRNQQIPCPHLLLIVLGVVANLSWWVLENIKINFSPAD